MSADEIERIFRIESRRALATPIRLLSDFDRCMGDGEIRIVQVNTPGFDDSRL